MGSGPARRPGERSRSRRGDAAEDVAGASARARRDRALTAPASVERRPKAEGSLTAWAVTAGLIIGRPADTIRFHNNRNERGLMKLTHVCVGLPLIVLLVTSASASAQDAVVKNDERTYGVASTVVHKLQAYAFQGET